MTIVWGGEAGSAVHLQRGSWVWGWGGLGLSVQPGTSGVGLAAVITTQDQAGVGLGEKGTPSLAAIQVLSVSRSEAFHPVGAFHCGPLWVTVAVLW